MGLHYSLETALGNLDRFSIPLYLGWGIAMVCFYIYYAESIRLGFKHKCSGMPWQTNMYNFANDAIYVAGFANWFSKTSPTHHWVTMFLWFGLVAWFLMEFIVHYQSIKWDLITEIFPNIKKRSHAVLLYWAIQVCFIAGYGFLWSVMDDPLVHIMFLTTFTCCCLFNFEMVGKRKSRKGVSPLVPWALAVAQISGYFIILPSTDPVMGNFYTYFMGVAATGIAIAFIVVYKRTPKYVVHEIENEPTLVK